MARLAMIKDGGGFEKELDNHLGPGGLWSQPHNAHTSELSPVSSLIISASLFVTSVNI